MNIGVIGTGYVGLVTGACFAEFGVQVVCADIDAEKIARLERGEVPIYEPGLEDIVERNIKQGRSRSRPTRARRRQLARAVHRGRDAAAARRQHRPALRRVGGARDRPHDGRVQGDREQEHGAGRHRRARARVDRGGAAATGRSVEFSVASNPEFLREGAAIGDFMRPDRVVIGADDSQATAILKSLYRPLYLIEAPVLITNVVTAELTKYAANAFLATKISFINEFANLCEEIGADVHDIARGIGLDRRIGPKFLHPGPGFGGSCFPKDTRSIAQFARQQGNPLAIVEAVVDVNVRQQRRMVDKITACLDGGRARQDDRHARALVQAGDRRHARLARARDRARAAGARARACRPTTRRRWTPCARSCPTSRSATTPIRRAAAPRRS
jgi:UDPglucose 6-dehydrogenase